MEGLLHGVMTDILPADDVPLYNQTVWNMTNHTPSPEDIENIELMRTDFKTTAGAIIKFAPPSRERSLAITHLENALMWTVAAIARKQPDQGVLFEDETVGSST